MSSLTTRNKEEQKKRYRFIGVEGAGLACTVIFTPWLGIPLMVWGAFIGWDWFKYRVKNGMRF